MAKMDDFEVARVLMDAINEATKRGLLRKSYVKVGPMMAATAMQLAVHKQHQALNNAGAQAEAGKQALRAAQLSAPTIYHPGAPVLNSPDSQAQGYQQATEALRAAHQGAKQ